MEIFFLRHGRSLADDEGKHEGRYDSPLTSIGRDEIYRRAEEWRNQDLKFDKIISSPLKRAAETAQIIGTALNCKIIYDDDWMEMNNGDLAGLTYEEAGEKFPMPAFRNPYYRVAKGSGESICQLHSRAMYALEKVIQENGERYLIVSHGGILNAAARMITGAHLPINNSGVYFGFRDAGFLHTEYKTDMHIWIVKKFDPGFDK